MTDVNFNYTFRFGNTKFEVDIGSSFSGDDLKEKRKNKDLLHYHAKHELFFVGDYPLTLVTERDTRDYKNCFLFIPHFLKHYTLRLNAFCILFSISDTGQRACEFSSFINRFFSRNCVFSFDRDENIASYLTQLKVLVDDTSETGRDAAISTLKLIFYNIYLKYSEVQNEGYSVRESYLITIENIINSYSLDPTKTVNLECVAKELHLGKKQTSRIIYKYFGKPLSELVLERKLALASTLLRSSDKSMSEIAKETNFHSDNYFFLSFKKVYGITPLAYRKKNKTK